MVKKRERVLALVTAILFFVSTVGFSALIIWQVNKQNSDNTINRQPKEGQLQGTKLNGYTPKDQVETLEVIDLQPGSGEEVPENATITAHYTGALAKDGTIFESSKDSGEPATFGLDQVIPGWTQGVPGMKVGGTRRLIIPAPLAYGEQSPSPAIPANSPLVFDIELVAIVK